jgi:hypothetical protein
MNTTKRPLSIKELLPELSDEEIFDRLRANEIQRELHDDRRWYQI